MTTLADRLFPNGHDIQRTDSLLAGPATVAGQTVEVLGCTDHAAIGADLGLRLAGSVLAVLHDHPGRPIVLLIDTSGQRMSRRDETLGLNRCIAHLAKAIDLARRRGHRVVAVVEGRAISAGFLATAMMADACFALPGADMGVMSLPAMARITRLPLDRLEDLAQSSPVFAPGCDNFHAMGAVEAIWQDDPAGALARALARPVEDGDTRRALGALRGGRAMALAVAKRLVRDATA